MTRIGGTDRVLMLLQEKIARAARDRAKAGRTDGIATPDAPAPARAFTPREGASERETHDALVRRVLVDSFGEGLANDPRFDALARDVARIIAESDGGPDLLSAALART